MLRKIFTQTLLYSAALLIHLPIEAAATKESHPASTKQARTERAFILYQTRSGNIARAVSQYRSFRSRLGQDDLELIEQMAAIMIEQGTRCSTPEDQLLAIYGAGISRNPQFIYILEQGLQNHEPLIQLASLQFLEEFHDDRADQIIKRAMASPFLAIRLEACLWLAKNRDPHAVGQIEGLYEKVDPALRPIFPQLFAMSGDARSVSILKQLLTNADPLVRLITIISAAKFQCDGLLPQIRSICLSPGVDEREACASALGELKDEQSAKMLEKLSQSANSHVRLASLHALYKLGRMHVRAEIEKLAKEGNIFAITILGEIPGAENTLYQLSQSKDLQIRTNATLALLGRRDSRCLPKMREILLKDPRDLLLIEQKSPGQSMNCWKVMSSTRQQFKDHFEEACQISISARESILSQAADLPINDFLCIAQEIFDSKQVELIPTLIELIESMENQNCIDFLKLQLHRAGAPLVRQYCNLALFRLQEPGPYAANLYKWIAQEKHSELIDFTPPAPLDLKSSNSTYTLTPSETSRLLIDSLTSLAEQKDPQAIDALLHVIAHGNPKNRYALAGLLIRAIE